MCNFSRSRGETRRAGVPRRRRVSKLAPNDLGEAKNIRVIHRLPNLLLFACARYPIHWVPNILER